MSNPAKKQDDDLYDDPMGEDFEPDEYDPGDDCGRWINGKLGRSCSQAGTEFCDWECPYS